jgi:hypothetical protein
MSAMTVSRWARGDDGGPVDVAPDEIGFLDDVPADVEAARLVGGHPVLHGESAASIAAVAGLVAG